MSIDVLTTNLSTTFHVISLLLRDNLFQHIWSGYMGVSQSYKETIMAFSGPAIVQNTHVLGPAWASLSVAFLEHTESIYKFLEAIYKVLEAIYKVF